MKTYVYTSSSLRRLLLVTVLFCWCGTANAEWRICVDNYSPMDYAAGTQNWQLLQQSNGWIYAANNYGLLEYDGETWRTYGIWNSTALRSLARGAEGEIYVGGSNDFGVFTGDSIGRLEYRSFLDSVPESWRTFGEIWNIIYKDSILYVQTRNCIFRRLPSGHIDVIPSDARIFCMASVGESIYVATAEGVSLLTGTRMDALRGSERLRGAEIRGIQRLGEDGVLIGTDFQGMYIYDGTEIRPFPTEIDGFLRSNQLYSFAVSDRYIAFGTVLQGIVLTDRRGHVCHYINQANGLQNNTVLNLIFDNGHNLWAGLDQGVSVVRLSLPVWRLHDNITDYGSGYTSCLRNNTLYFGTNQGLYYASSDTDGRNVQALHLVEGSLGQVWNLDEVADALFCCHNRGLFLVEGTRLVPVCTDEGFWCVRQYSDNCLLAGSYSGIWLLQKRAGRWVAVRHISGFEDTALHFEVDATGVIWIVSQQGVERLAMNNTMEHFSAELVRPFNQQHDFFDMAKIDNRIFISSADCCMMVGTSGILESAGEFCRLLDGEQHYPLVRKDEYNNLWYLSGNVLKVRRYDMYHRSYAAEAVCVINSDNFFIGGFAHLNCIGGNCAVIGGVHGFYFVDWEALSAMAQPLQPEIYIRRMRLLGGGNTVLYGEAWQTGERHISLPYGSYSVSFELGSNSCFDDGRVYATRLLPIEKDFVVMGESNKRDFTALKDGNYTLETTLYSPRYNRTTTAVFTFRIAPPWYRTLTAYILYGVAACLLIALVVWSIVRWAAKGKQRIAKEKDARLAEQKAHWSEEMDKQQLMILQLQKEKAEYELRNKSKELSNLLLTKVNRNELIAGIQEEVRKVADCLKTNDVRRASDKLQQLQAKLSRNQDNEIDWQRFEENFDIVNDRFLKKLSTRFPWMTKEERKLCVYIHMGLLTKEIAPLMNLSTRGVEMMRYRLRRKMGLDAQANLRTCFTEIIEEDNSIE